MKNLNQRIPTREEVNSIDIVSFLESIDVYPTRISYPHYWYKSLLSKKKTSNFRVQRKLNLWNDFDLNEGGTLVQFCERYYNCSEEEVLKKFIGIEKLKEVPRVAPRYFKSDTSQISNLQIRPLVTRPLLAFLSSRRIDHAIAQNFCAEAHYEIGEMKYYAISFENRSGGFELQNKFFRGQDGPIDFTLIDNKTGLLCVFVDFLDFLSFVTICKGQPIPQADFLILNELGLMDACQDVICSHQKTLLYFPNTPAATKAVQRAVSWSNSIADQRAIYSHYESVNQWLCQIGHSREVSLFNGLSTQ
ncbi:MAG: hypothetical protein P4L51_23820 [Puia sp.]|nr:hypothetical protein [Puia sp.]